MLISLSLALLSLCCASLAHEEWVDPNDPTSFVPTSHGLKSVPPDVADTQKCPETSFEPDPSLRLILRRLFNRIHVDPAQKAYFSRTARLSLSSYNMATIAEYLESDSSPTEASQRERVRSALHNFAELIDEDDSYMSVWSSFLSLIRPWILMANVVILVPATFFVLRNVLSARSFWWTVFSLIILVSMVTTYNRMYQERLSARMAASIEMQGDACAPAGLFEQGLDFLAGMVQFKKKSRCLQFIESQTVSIVAEISLLDVFSNVLSNGLFGWLSSLGFHLNKFYRDLFHEVPIPAMCLIIISMIFLFVRIKTPVFTIEPLFISLLGGVCQSAISTVLAPEPPAAVEPPDNLPAVDGGRPTASQSQPALGRVPSTKGNSMALVTKRTPESRIRNMERRRAAERRERDGLRHRRDASDSSLATANDSEDSGARDRSIGRGSPI